MSHTTKYSFAKKFTKPALLGRLENMEFLENVDSADKDDLIIQLENLTIDNTIDLLRELDETWKGLTTYSGYYTGTNIDLLRKYLPAMMKIPECVCLILHKQCYSSERSVPIFFSYLDEHMKSDVELVCYFHSTIKDYSFGCMPNYREDMLTMLENDKFPHDEEYGYYNRCLEAIPQYRRAQLVHALRIIREQYNISVFKHYNVYKKIHKIMTQYNIERATKHMRRNYDTCISFN